MKEVLRAVTLLITLAITSTGHTQPYGQEWIDFNKDYYRVALAEDGIYRITFADLQNAGFPVTSIDPRRLQLFYKGVEQAIFVSGQGDAVFNTSDFIEFYGQHNDGIGDTRLYEPETAQPHTFYSIYSDSSSYFLTYNLTPIDGKRMSTFSANNTGLAPLASHNEESRTLITDRYSLGQGFSSEDFTKFTYFDFGEGWTGTAIQENESITYTVTDIINGATSEGNPRIEILFTGRDDLPHRATVSVGQNTGTLRNVGSIDFNNYESITFSSEINWSDISAEGNLTVEIEGSASSGSNARFSMSYIRVFYPQSYEMSGSESKVFNIEPQAGATSYIEILNTPAQVQLYDITDLNNIVRIGSNSITNGIGAIINQTLSARTIFLNGTTFNTPIISSISFRQIDPEDHDYIILSNKFLMQPAGGSPNPVKAFADYRASNGGGGFDTLVVDIDLLYNQFNYGIKSPLAIFDFMRFIVNEGSPEFFFIIGKGLGPNIPFHRDPDGVINVNEFEIRDLVPAAGDPGSDIFFTAGLGGTSFEPAVPTGRLPARNSQQVINYLNKVIETEALPFDNLWRKNILHLSGGISQAELINFRNFMDEFKSVAESDFLGGDVETIAKTSGSLDELIPISEQVNQGLNLVTFFGHSAPNITDIDIGFVTDDALGYSNNGRYPMFLINGCNAGEFFDTQIVFGEDWVLAADRGAVGFIAHSSFGFTNNLKRYSDFFYEVGYADSTFVSLSIGEIQKEVALRYMQSNSPTPNNITQVQQMVLLGDPAVNLFGADQPDYSLTDDDIFIESFNDDPVSALSDSFAVNVIVRNFGITTTDSVTVSLTRTLADNSIVNYDSIFPSIDYQDTITFIVLRENTGGFGVNRFSIELDSDFRFEELNETNNTGELDFFVPLFGTRNLYPLNYGIVPEPSVELVAQSTNLIEDERQFIFELDTAISFNSPFKRINTISSKLLSRWQVNLLPISSTGDSVVYYWRTHYADVREGESDEWSTSSFIYINDGPEGWSQTRFDQLANGELLGLVINESAERFDFNSVFRKLDITTFGSDNPATNADVSVRIDDEEFIIDNQKRCRDNTLNLIAFDKNDAVPYAAVPFIFQDARSCGRQPQVINSFRLSELEIAQEGVEAFIDNMQTGDSVVLFSIGNIQPNSWSPTVINKLSEVGISNSSITNLTNGEPFIFFGAKGASSGTAEEVLTPIDPKTEQQLSATFNFSGVFSQGSVTSGIIGPADEWFRLEGAVADDAIDDWSLSLLGVDLQGNEEILFESLTTLPVDLSMVNSSEYPFIKLQFNNSDLTNLTPPQLRRWQVIYTPVAEGIVIATSPDIDVVNVREGENLSRQFGFLNISNKEFADSLSVVQSLFNRDSRTNTSLQFNIAAPSPGDTTNFTTDITTRSKVGQNDFQINVNPRQQMEQYYENNLLNLSNNITVERDNIDPLLDVLFDGRYILDGDIVSPTPLISITLKDENPFIRVVDTTAVQLFIREECEGCAFRRVAFSSPNINWFATTEEEDFRIEYRPDRFDDGIYQLRIEATDESGNSSGDEPYLISFEVVNETTITNFYPYPNPFSTSTRFVFTLTGSEVPNELIIRIMTVSGRVVREITSSQFGAIHIGNNISDFAWDGRDEFGDQLANGVYLYTVIVKQNGETLKQRSTSADKAFKNGFGKLYILR